MTEERNNFGWLISRPLVWALVYSALIAFGVYALWRIPVEVLPRFNFPEISVVTHRPGATARTLEAQIAWPIEDEILALPNLESVRSTMGNGVVETDARFRQGTDPMADLQSVNSAIDRARERIPASAHPYAEIMGNAINEVADYTAHIPATVSPAAVERDVSANVVPALRALPGVQRVEVYGAGKEALWVQPNLSAMVRYRVPITALTAALRRDVVVKSGGYLTEGHQDVFIDVRNLPLHIRDLERLPIPSANGPIPLRDLARIVRSPVPTLNAVYFNRQPGIALIVFKQPDASTVPVTRAVAAMLAQTSGQLPAGVRWVRIYDQGYIVHLVGRDLTTDLIIGGLLAIAVILWILGAQGGVWILAVSIPLSLLIGIAGLFAAGHGLNLITLGALSIAVGLLTDDGIIVLESIYHRWEQGDNHHQGIIRGLKDIARPDIIGTLTVVSVFVPLLFVGGLARLFFLPFALAMTFVLLASLAISLTLVPLSLHLLKVRPRAEPTKAGKALARIREWNMRMFHAVARNPRLSLVACVALLLLSLAGLGLVPINFLPLPNEGVLLESFALPPGTSLLDTEAAVSAMTKRMRRDPAVAYTLARIGSASNTTYSEPSYAGEIQIKLKPDIGVNSLTGIGNRLLKESQIPAVLLSIDTPTIERVGESLSGLPQPFVLQLFGPRIGKLRELSERIAARLKTVSALHSVFNTDAYPVTELQLQPKTAALAVYGLTPLELDTQVNPLLNGEVVAQVPQGNVPLDLYVRLAGAQQISLAKLKNLPIRTASWTPLGQLANLKMVATPNQIRHIDGARALEIVATPTGPLGSTITAARRALASLRLPEGYRYKFAGLFEELESTALDLGLAAIAALVLMTGIMMLQFDGLLLPGLLLLQIPLAFTGGVAALVLSGVGLNGVGLVAFLTLVGIGLNHGIVLFHRARSNEAAGMTVDNAVADAVRVRFRPISLTTLTAVLGMLPIALGWGQGAAPEQGLAVVITGGILWSALLSVNLIPALYLHYRKRQIAREATR